MKKVSNEEEFKGIIRTYDPNIVINDILDTNIDYMKQLKEELTDKKETLDMRIKTLQRQEERSKKQRDEMREKLARQIQGEPGTAAQ